MNSDLVGVMLSPDGEFASFMGTAESNGAPRMVQYDMEGDTFFEELRERRAAIAEPTPETVNAMMQDWYSQLCRLALMEKAAA